MSGFENTENGGIAESGRGGATTASGAHSKFIQETNWRYVEYGQIRSI